MSSFKRGLMEVAEPARFFLSLVCMLALVACTGGFMAGFVAMVIGAFAWVSGDPLVSGMPIAVPIIWIGSFIGGVLMVAAIGKLTEA